MASLRRLAKDHAALRASLPPNYLFPPSDDCDSLPDDLTQLSVYLTGSDGTPYSSGLWLLHLRMPIDYPKSPPKATFKTRIFHPNVEESSGAVCLETLKRDWDPKLTLKDILVTISCLLIQPNPDSALNEKAGVLVREDYEGFIKQAKLMTRIHAPIPPELKTLVDEARRRGEDDDDRCRTIIVQKPEPVLVFKQGTSTVTVDEMSHNESEDSAKENNPAHFTTKIQVGASQLRNVLGKRPLTEVTATPDNEESAVLHPSQRSTQVDVGEPPRKSPKHTHLSQAGGRSTSSSSNDINEATINVSDQDEIISICLSTPASHLSSLKKFAPTKYRTYARIGIKRL